MSQFPSAALLALLSAALFGASTPLAKLLLGQVSPWLLAGLLYLGAGLGLAAVQAVRLHNNARPTEAPLQKSDLPWLVAVVVSGGIAGPVLLMQGLTSTPASSAALLLNLEGLFTLAIAWTAFKENVDIRVGIGAAAILGGALILSWHPSLGFTVTWGELAIAGACLAWAVDNNLTRKVSGADPIQIASIKGLAAGIVNVGLAIAQSAALPSIPVVAGSALVGFVGYGVSLVLFVLALRHLGTARTGAYFSTAPFIGAVVAIVLIGEPVTPTLLVAAVLMAIGLYLHLAERHEHEHEHAPLVHEHRHTHDEHHQHIHDDAAPMGEPHSHVHVHARLIHRHPHYPDLHHRHTH
jgi:drug/metabolite transporter (DMT)-like permease